MPAPGHDRGFEIKILVRFSRLDSVRAVLGNGMAEDPLENEEQVATLLII